MDRLLAMQIFVRIAQRSSFTQASDDLMLPRATVSNRIRALEQHLGVRLIERTTRQVRLTAEGESYYRRCVRILADVEEADNAFKTVEPKGGLRVSLQGTLAKHFVLPRLAEFVTRYPQLSLQLSEGDRLVDLVKEGIDCVLRAGELADSSLVARRLALIRQVTVASPAYLQRYGPLMSPQALDGHQVVGYLSSKGGLDCSLSFRQAKRYHSVELPSLITVDGAEMYTGAALAGLGLIQVPYYRIEAELAKGLLQEVLTEYPPEPMPVSVVYAQNRQLSVRIRCWVEWLSQIFTSVPDRYKK